MASKNQSGSNVSSTPSLTHEESHIKIHPDMNDSRNEFDKTLDLTENESALMDGIEDLSNPLLEIDSTLEFESNIYLNDCDKSGLEEERENTNIDVQNNKTQINEQNVDKEEERLALNRIHEELMEDFFD